MRRWILFAGLMLTALFAGCGDDADRNRATEDDKKRTETDKTPTTEEASWDLDWHVINAKDGLYDITDVTEDTGDIMDVAMYDDDVLLVLKMDTEKVLSVELISLSDGRMVTACSVQMNDYEASYGNALDFEIMHTSPLVVNRSATNELITFSGDFSECTIFGESDENAYISYICDDDCMYFMNSADQRLYRYAMPYGDLVSDDGTYEITEQGRIESTTIELSDIGEEVWRPDTDMTNCCIISADDEELCMEIYDMANECYFYVLYDTEDGEYEELFTMDEFYDYFDTDLSYAICYEYPEDVTELVYYDFEHGRKYQTDMPVEDTEDAEDYVWYDVGAIMVEPELYLPVIAYTNGDEAYVSCIYLWDYAAGTGSSCNAATKTAYAMDEEVDYGEATQRAKQMEETYGIQIVLGANVKDQLPDYDAEVCEDTSLMMSAMDDIEEAFGIYPTGFIDELTEGCFISITIYLTGTLTTKDEELYISQAGAVTSTTWGYQMMAIDMNESDIRSTIVHELCHVIDNKLEQSGVTSELNEAWSAYNPEGYSYYDSYIGYEEDYEYTSYDEAYFTSGDAETVYFYDDYSKTYVGEDRARLMEHFTEWEYLEDCYNSSHIQGKIGVFLTYLYDNFASIRNADSFEWQETYDRLISEGTP